MIIRGHYEQLNINKLGNLDERDKTPEKLQTTKTQE